MSINTNSSSYFNETDDIIVSHSGVINEKVISEKGGLSCVDRNYLKLIFQT